MSDEDGSSDGLKAWNLVIWWCSLFSSSLSTSVARTPTYPFFLEFENAARKILHRGMRGLRCHLHLRWPQKGRRRFVEMNMELLVRIAFRSLKRRACANVHKLYEMSVHA
jgi:hypothetical protein